MMSRIEGITRRDILGLEWHYQFHKITCWHFNTLYNTGNIFSNNLCSTISTKNSRWKKKKLGRFSRLIFSVWPCWPFRWFVWGSGRTLRWPGPRCRPPWGPSSQLLWPDPVDTGKWLPQPRSSGSCRIACKERWNILFWKSESKKESFSSKRVISSIEGGGLRNGLMLGFHKKCSKMKTFFKDNQTGSPIYSWRGPICWPFSGHCSLFSGLALAKGSPNSSAINTSLSRGDYIYSLVDLRQLECPILCKGRQPRPEALNIPGLCFSCHRRGWWRHRRRRWRHSRLLLDDRVDVEVVAAAAPAAGGARNLGLIALAVVFETA